MRFPGCLLFAFASFRWRSGAGNRAVNAARFRGSVSSPFFGRDFETSIRNPLWEGDPLAAVRDDFFARVPGCVSRPTSGEKYAGRRQRGVGCTYAENLSILALGRSRMAAWPMSASQHAV